MTRRHLFEQRCDPISGRQVLIAENRAGRPNDFVARESECRTQTDRIDCPFCAGHESQTPQALFESMGPDGQWQVRVVPNKYPAVALEQDPRQLSGSAAVDSTPARAMGVHEVIIESPHHVQDITELTQPDFQLVLQVYRDRLRHWSDDDRLQFAFVFKNVGVAAGASLEHIHSQLVALPEVPPFMAAELRASEQHLAAHGSCVYCRLLAEELAQGERLVAANELFVAFCAYAGRQPYETWILPRQHAAHFHESTDTQTEVLAGLLQDLVVRLRKELNPLSYNLILHSAPFGQAVGSFHWHLELVPRSTRLAGFEWGSGMHINPLSPERAAAQLRITSA